MAEESNWQPPTEEQFNQEWLLPKTAVDLVRPVHDNERAATQKWIVSRLKAGLILAVTRTFELRGEHLSFIMLDKVFFEDWSEYGDRHFWQTGDAEFYIQGAFGRAFDIRFDPENFSSSVPKTSLPASIPQLSRHLGPVPAAPNKGGAPRKGWWDDLWIEMIRRIRADDLHPASGNDLKRIMEDWLGDQGIYPGDDTLKKTANKLFKYLQK